VSSEGSAQGGADPQPHFCAASAGAERAGQGVSESDDAAHHRRVEVWFVPTGGMLPPSVKDQKDAATLSVSALGCPKRQHAGQCSKGTLVRLNFANEEKGPVRIAAAGLLIARSTS